MTTRGGRVLPALARETPGIYPGPIHGLTLILGGRGSGKTTLLQGLERRARVHRSERAPAGVLVLVWDRMGQWGEAPGRVVVRSETAEHAAQVAIRMSPCVLVLDECSFAIPSRGLSSETALCEILRTGRQAKGLDPWKRRGPVAVLAASQRPSQLWTELKELADLCLLGFFPPQARESLKWIRDGWGDETASRLVTLRAGEFMRFENMP